MKLDIVIPAYNEQDNIATTIEDIQNAIAKIPIIETHQIYVIDDHSEDNTFETVRDIRQDNIHCLRLSKRSGSHTAIRAGIEASKGDALLCIAADGQDNAGSILEEMLHKLKQKNYIVWGMRQSRKNEPLSVKLFAILFYKIVFWLTQVKNSHINYANVTFFVLDKKVVKAIKHFTETNTSLLGLLLWSGFKQDYVEYERKERVHGKSKWNFRSRWKLAKDWILSFSALPLRLITYIGISFASLGFMYALVIVVLALMGKTAPGFAEPVTLALLIGGVQMTMLGILGEYLWRILDESRKRPLYFIEESTKET
ncbi:MAG: glycosyltransferase [Cytophagales bacterium]|nr:MAG: glycosyltransferase [Cytophagales bacterium]